MEEKIIDNLNITETFEMEGVLALKPIGDWLADEFNKQYYEKK